MTRRIFSFDKPDRFVCGAIGQPGRRIFFLQATRGPQVISVALEKAQVALLAERLAILLVDLRERGVETGSADQPPDAHPLIEPIIEQFRVGTLTLSWDTERERVVIEARELTEDDGAAEEDEEDEDDEPRPFVAQDVGDGPDVIRVQLAPTDARAFVTRAVAVVQAGRPPCPNCGAPLDPGGHFCPRRNGFTH